MSGELGFGYDSAWNVNYRTNNALVQSFGVDSLNQLTNRTGSSLYLARSLETVRRSCRNGGMLRPPRIEYPGATSHT